SFAGYGLQGGGYSVYVAGRDKFVPAAQDPTTGLITMGAPYLKRTPWYIQTDFNFQQSYKVTESKMLSFSATFQNLFNERSVTAVNESIDSGYANNFIGTPQGYSLANGAPFYQATFQPYNFAALSNAALSNINCPSTKNPTGVCGPLTISSGYGQPN